MAEYWAWLEALDPDVIYSYVHLERPEILELNERLYPAQYIFHNQQGELRLDVFGFKPRYQFTPLASMSVIFRLARYGGLSRGYGIVRVIDSWHTETPSRLLTDNLGTYHHSQGGSTFPADALAASNLLTVVSPEKKADRRYGVPRDLDTVDNEMSVLSAFVNKEATSLSVLSAQFASKLNIRAGNWSESFNLVVGDEFGDRIMFWNARLMIPDWLDNDICCFSVDLDHLKDPDFLPILGDLLNQRNHVNNGTGGQPQVFVRSASLTAAELAEAHALVLSAKPWGGIRIESVSGLASAIPSDAALDNAREGNRFGSGPFARPDWTRFRWSPPRARPPVATPDHLLDAPVRQAFTTGYWCTDLSLQYDGPGSRSSDNNSWAIPRRWRIAGAFNATVVGATLHTAPPLLRRSREGNLAILMCMDHPLEELRVPTPYEAIQYALAADGAWSNPSAKHGEVQAKNKVVWTDPSNEARYLAGVLGMAGGLRRAGQFLLHPFLREQFSKLGGTPRLPMDQVQVTANRLQKMSRQKATFDLRSETERNALAEIIAKTARAIKSPVEFVSYAGLKSDWKKYRSRYWAENPQPSDPNSNFDWDSHEEQSLDTCLIEMRRRQMIFQGHRWTCSNCHHRNWVSLTALSSDIPCEVCKLPTPAPLSIGWLFRPSEFLIESLRDHSVLSLIWVLEALRWNSRRSFMFVGPTNFGFNSDSQSPDAEADLLAVVDGRAVVCEVKSSWNSLRATDILTLVELAKRLRPDVALLAVMERGVGLKPQLDAAKKELADVGIEFRLFTIDNYDVSDDPYLTFEDLS